GHIGATAAKSDTEAVGRINLDQILRRAGKRQPDAKQDHADHSERTRAEAIGQWAADDPQPEIQKAGQRERQRHRTARGAEVALKLLEERAEGVGAAKAQER